MEETSFIVGRFVLRQTSATLTVGVGSSRNSQSTLDNRHTLGRGVCQGLSQVPPLSEGRTPTQEECKGCIVLGHIW